MGLPEIIVDFKKKAETIKFRSARGIVALILEDTVSDKESFDFNSFSEVDAKIFSEKNYEYIKLAFMGNPYKVIIEIVNSLSDAERGLEGALKELENKSFNYLAVPNIESEEQKENIVTWIVTNRNKKKRFKAVLPNVSKADEKGVINFTTDGIKVRDKEYKTSEYTSRIAGILAGISLTQSSTYFVLDELTSITSVDDPDKAIDSGELILINDGSKIKIARGVTSMVTVGEDEIEDFKKIKVLETADMIFTDIWETWDNYYVGKVPNTYVNKILYFNTVNDYFNNLVYDEIFDSDRESYVQIDIDAHKKYLKDKNIDYSEMSEQQIKEAKTGSHVFGEGQIAIADAMEDLILKLFM